jgi:hypothetical protein
LFFVLTQRTKSQVGKEASLRPGHAAQAGRTTGCNLFPRLRALPPLQEKLAMPLPTRMATLFCPLFAEAVLPTER